MRASLTGNLEVVKKLIALGADVGAVDENGKTALSYASDAEDKRTEIMALLKGKDAK